MSDAPPKPGADPTGSSAQRRWQFIDASQNSSDNLTQVKRHVMQEYMRQKRQKGQRGDETQGNKSDSRKSRQSVRSQKSKEATASSETDQTDKRKKAKGKEADRGGGDGYKQEIWRVERDVQLGPTSDSGSGDIEEIERISPESSATSRHPDISLSPSAALLVPHRYTLDNDRMGEILDLESILDDDLTQPGAILARYPSSTSDFSDILSRSSVQSTPGPHSSPRSILSAARTDPFDTLPLQLNAEEKKLFDFYVNEMPACSYGTHFRSAKAHNWYTAVFVPEAMKGGVCFQNTILVHAASTWAWVRNETETANTLIHRGRALTMLREHLREHPDDVSDVAIIACLSAAALEDFDPRPGHKEISWMHMRAARRMIRNRGGPSAFENTRLAMLINWQDYILAGYETRGPSFYYEHNPKFSPLLYKLSSPNLFGSPSQIASSADLAHAPEYALEGKFPLSPQEELGLQCEEFIDFLERAERLALGQATSYDFSPIRRAHFQDGALLHTILAAPPGKRFTSSGNRKQFIARLAALMMINAAFWDYRFSAQQSDLFQKVLARRMLESEVEMSGSVEALLQILLACEDCCIIEEDLAFSSPASSANTRTYDSPDYSQYSPTAKSPFPRPWFVGRMLKVAKRLCLESWERVNDILFSCLTLQLEGCVVPYWADELRREILQAPLTSYVMPALSSLPGT
ncbi:sigma-70 region 2 family protein [Paecilomyces variotii No. 5]|uniref:Sigma-70 region 2 family protein n=1 Tax=Byssochlamys spectabilis (strain No. 5 / NBRC 109023) TaxID=1356009 RepID=V5FR14_BYSSN|nr:sigma-70 region 2 family protein [Paecilomyces variotii No. 5]